MIGRPKVSYLPSLVLCSNLSDMFLLPGDFYQYRITHLLSDLFNQTPSEKSMINSGSYFVNGTIYSQDFNSSKINKLFKREKLIKKSDVCYSIKHIEPFEFDYRTVTTTSVEPMLLKFLFESRFIHKPTEFNFFIHSYESSFHGVSNTLASVSLFPDDKNATDNVTDIQLQDVKLTYTEYVNILLPYPYDTDCFDYRPLYKSDKHCYDDCHLANSVKIRAMYLNQCLNMML